MKYLFFSALLAFSLSSFAQVGVGTLTPNASSVLDVTSTTQGFLPPRMTLAQRDAIGTPAQGLMIYCTDCGAAGGEPEYYNGTAWKSMASNSPAIGDSYGGGIIAYTLQSGDPGYIAGQVHGLIAAASDQSMGIKWSNSNSNTGATAVVLGTGNANTIVAAQGAGSYAAQLCYDLVLNGYSDWYLPRRDELSKLFLNQIAIGGFSTILNYWSSSEVNSQNAWDQDFTNFPPTFGFKLLSPSYVRAVRAF